MSRTRLIFRTDGDGQEPPFPKDWKPGAALLAHEDGGVSMVLMWADDDDRKCLVQAMLPKEGAVSFAEAYAATAKAARKGKAAMRTLAIEAWGHVQKRSATLSVLQ